MSQPDIFDLSARFPVPRTKWGTRIRTWPITRDPTHFQFTEKLDACRSTYVRAVLGVPHPQYPTAILVDENPESETGDHLILSRTYSTVPASRSEPTTIAFQFPGFQVPDGLSVRITREPQTLTVLAREQYDYFLTDDPFGEVDPANEIEILTAFNPVASVGSFDTAQYLNDAGGSLPDATIPSLTEYTTMAGDGEEIVVKDSELRQYAGNIWERKTLYAKAR